MKALFFDIDGTLLSEITKEIPASALEAVRKAKEAGHQTFINTGRTWSALPKEIRSLPFSGFLCGCGTYIRYGEEVLFHQAIPAKRCAELPSLIQRNGGDMIMEGTEDIYFSARTSRFAPLEGTRRYFRDMGLGVEKTAESQNLSYDKLIIYADGQTDCEAIFSDLRADMEIMDRRGGVYEIIQKPYTKATAISYILDHFGISREDAYAFGDSSNDLAMFQCGIHAVAMGHHDPVLAPYAEYVTTTVEDDGIYHAMEHYQLLG